MTGVNDENSVEKVLCFFQLNLPHVVLIKNVDPQGLKAIYKLLIELSKEEIDFEALGDRKRLNREQIKYLHE
ncbi:CLUMA_CG007489, isoform A [Clunio marinus]|uniref:CLUMA_CG007489, isoform A n=1 Tax=Clunio marinus TaxID=568069 RepID=A0A1J1I183_9DIPT|nr:CLUMA_CG007489, isoform A [Clunio marinus]